jgi:HlyD family secretion protein
MKKLIITLFVVAAIAGSVGAYYMRRGSVGPQVSTAAVSRGDIVDSVGATGTLQAVTSVQVGSQVSGIIAELNADFNSIVHKGQVIARLDPSLFQTQIEQAQANLLRAQADVERLKVAVDDAKTKLRRTEELAARKLVAPQDLETAQVNVRAADAQLKSSQAQVTQAQASLNQNQVNLEHTVIAAPIDGIVVSRNVDIGQTVAASFQSPTLFIIAADLTKMQVNASVDEADVGRIRPGQHVRFRVDAYPTDEFTGTVSQVRLQPIVVQNVVTYGTVIDVPNPDLRLKPGMTANVTIEIARRTDALRVPNSALRFRPTPDIFAALGQAVPPELQRGAAGRGRTAEAGTGAGAPGAPAVPGTASTASSSTAAPPQQPSGSPRAVGNASRRGPSPQDAPGGGRPSGTVAPGGLSAPAGADQGGMDPERRQRMMARLQQMSPEERQQFIERLKQRGISVPGADATAPGERPAAKPPQKAAAIEKGAQTIDSLFGPLPPVVSSGRAWMYVNKELKMVRLRLGISDGTYTELLDGSLQPGTELVSSVILGSEQASSLGGGRSPLMQQRGGPMGRGGPGGPR